jgi:hypothetical protein
MPTINLGFWGDAILCFWANAVAVSTNTKRGVRRDLNIIIKVNVDAKVMLNMDLKKLI